MYKFKDRRTGEVFDNILDAHYWYRCPGPCTECELSSDSKCNEDWIESHPIAAAEIMGFDIIDIDGRPNLARILGVGNAYGSRSSASRNDTKSKQN